MDSEEYVQPSCKDCKYFRQISDIKFVCGKYTLKMQPLSRTELRSGCWENKARNNEILELKPNFQEITGRITTI